jgi:hypothetical protein
MSFSNYIPLLPSISEMVEGEIEFAIGNITNSFTTELQDLSNSFSTQLQNVINSFSNQIQNLNSIINQQYNQLEGQINTISGNVESLTTQLTNLTTTVNNLSTTVSNIQGNIPPYYPINGYNFYQMSGNLQARLNLYALHLINDGPNLFMFNFYNITGNIGQSCVGNWPSSYSFPKYYFVQTGNVNGGAVSLQSGHYRLNLDGDNSFQLTLEDLIPPPLSKVNKDDKVNKVIKEFKQLSPATSVTNDAISFLVYWQ